MTEYYPRIRRHVIVLTLAYGAIYLCRSSLSVTTPLIEADLGSAGVGLRQIGALASAGLAAYALGKLASGPVTDRLGGGRVLLTAMLGAAACSVIFGLSSSMPVLMVVWTANRLVQSPAWNGVVQMASQVVPFARSGMAMGTISLSFLFGDSLVRLILGALIAAGLTWRGVFVASAVALAAIALAVTPWIRSSRGAWGSTSDGRASSPRAVGPARASVDRPGPDERTETQPVWRSPALWSIAGLSAGLTFLREAITFWTPHWLATSFAVAPAAAALASALVPFAGGLSSLAVGTLSDRVPGGHRLVVAAPFLLVMTVLLAVIAVSPPADAVTAALLASSVAFALTGPYVLLAGAVAIDLGGRSRSATASGLIDGIGYVGAIAAGSVVATVADASGWAPVFGGLAGLGGLLTGWATIHARMAVRTR